MDISINVPFVVRSLDDEPPEATQARAVEGLRRFVRHMARNGRALVPVDQVDGLTMQELVAAARPGIIQFVLDCISAEVVNEASDAARHEAQAAVASQIGLLQ